MTSHGLVGSCLLLAGVCRLTWSLVGTSVSRVVQGGSGEGVSPNHCRRGSLSQPLQEGESLPTTAGGESLPTTAGGGVSQPLGGGGGGGCLSQPLGEGVSLPTTAGGGVSPNHCGRGCLSQPLGEGVSLPTTAGGGVSPNHCGRGCLSQPLLSQPLREGVSPNHCRRGCLPTTAGGGVSPNHWGRGCLSQPLREANETKPHTTLFDYTGVAQMQTPSGHEFLSGGVVVCTMLSSYLVKWLA